MNFSRGAVFSYLFFHTYRSAEQGSIGWPAITRIGDTLGDTRVGQTRYFTQRRACNGGNNAGALGDHANDTVECVADVDVVLAIYRHA